MANRVVAKGEKGKEHGKLYQDQLYGTKVLSPLAVAIIDTPEFQRLAGMRQLGFTEVVYRGAQHTRFSHSVGTYFMTRTIMRRIGQNHERLGLPHPGEGLPECFRIYPINAFPDAEEEQEPVKTSNQSLWRGLTEVVSIAALLHDLSHIPFGHTLEDEFVGIYEKHDKLGSQRLWEMLFNDNSDLRKVFLDTGARWICGSKGKGGLSNQELVRLIYVILSWDEVISPPTSFDSILSIGISDEAKPGNIPAEIRIKQLSDLRDWYRDFKTRRMFHPFMSDIIGNTICADLLDYLPRDRMNLGMEFRRHERLQRYLTIREGTLYPEEGLRVSIMVTRPGRGGQRRDVATAVLDIMRERYEMAERVYYHHKKSAASAMLAKMVELSAERRLLDDRNIYPAPWNTNGGLLRYKNVVHFSDSMFIDYYGAVDVSGGAKDLQRELYAGLRYNRKSIFRTLMVVDTDLVNLSSRPISYFAKALREYEGKPSSKGRNDLERSLAAAAGVSDGHVLIYCPSPNMQSKEVNARLEIIEKRVLPLSVQRESFAYQSDVKVLERYYQDLWRMYIFVSPKVYEQRAACQAIVDMFCDTYGIDKLIAYSKVRHYDFKLSYDVLAKNAIEPLRAFIDPYDKEAVPFRDVPQDIVAALLSKGSNDPTYLKCIKRGDDPFPRIASMFDMVILEKESKNHPKGTTNFKTIQRHINALRGGTATSRLKAAREKVTGVPEYNYDHYARELVEVALSNLVK